MQSRRRCIQHVLKLILIFLTEKIILKDKGSNLDEAHEVFIDGATCDLHLEDDFAPLKQSNNKDAVNEYSPLKNACSQTNDASSFDDEMQLDELMIEDDEKCIFDMTALLNKGPKRLELIDKPQKTMDNDIFGEKNNKLRRSSPLISHEFNTTENDIPRSFSPHSFHWSSEGASDNPLLDTNKSSEQTKRRISASFSFCGPSLLKASLKSSIETVLQKLIFVDEQFTLVDYFDLYKQRRPANEEKMVINEGLHKMLKRVFKLDINLMVSLCGELVLIDSDGTPIHDW